MSESTGQTVGVDGHVRPLRRTDGRHLVGPKAHDMTMKLVPDGAATPVGTE